MNKLQEVRYAAAYTALAQKLDMHIKNFDSDPNTQTRWIWELIQNAKDAPNRFKKIKIKQELDDYHFTSSHNGDAFEIHQLHSVVAQYSTKKQKNNQETKTTGKYGTGFITTYILSKIVQLTGILKVQIEVDSQDESQKQDQNSQDNEKQNQLALLSMFKKLDLNKSSKFKNNQKAYRYIKSQIKQKYKPQYGHKSSHIRKSKKNKDLERKKRQLIFQKQFERLKLDEQIEYEKEMELLEAELSGLSTHEKGVSSHKKEISKIQSDKNKKKSVLEVKPKEQKKKKVSHIHYYKSFCIPMDRSYTDRDEQLPKKIQKTQKKLTKVVVEAEYQSRNLPDFTTRDYYQKRTVDSYDTTFQYKISEKVKFTMIDKTIMNVRQLIPYALLFNDNLAYYEYIDNRKQPTNLSFSIQKGEIVQIQPNISLFSYDIKEEYNHKKKKFQSTKTGYFIAYFNKQKAIAAVPVEIEGDLIHILRINQNLPKIFKDFPLIGCSDLKWNVVINSREFYPNEKRSELMLNFIDKTNQEKVQTNWVNLYSCYAAVKEVYIFLSASCQYGLQNLLIMSSQNAMTLANREFKAYLHNLVQQISSTKFIPTRGSLSIQQRASVQPKNFIFIQLAYLDVQVYNKDRTSHYNLSYRTNQIFNFLYGDHLTLKSQFYEDFYEIIHYKSQYRQFLVDNRIIQFVSLNDCLRKLQMLTFKHFCVKIKVNFIQKLHQIYSLLRDYNEFAYLSLSRQPCFDFNIYLNENSQFKRLRHNHLNFNALPQVYQQLCVTFDIEVKQKLIHKEFGKYIKQTDNRFFYDVRKLQLDIQKYFQNFLLTPNQKRHPIFNPDQFLNQNKNIILNMHKLIKLFRLLITFKMIGKQTQCLIQKFLAFNAIEVFTFKSDTSKIQKFDKQVEAKLLSYFIVGFKIYFQALINLNPDFRSFLNTILIVKNQDQGINFLKDLFKDKLMGITLGKIQKKMNWSGKFVHETQLQKLNQKVAYPDQNDIRIYNLGYKIYKYGTKVNYEYQHLQNRLIHPLYPYYHLENVVIRTYSHFYYPIRQQYNNLHQQNKYEILTYVKNICALHDNGTHQDQTIIQKYKAWQKQIKERLQKLFELKTSNKQLEQQKTKQFLYNLLDNPSQLKNATTIYKNNGYKMYFADLCKQLGLQGGKKETQKPKQLAKK